MNNKQLFSFIVAVMMAAAGNAAEPRNPLNVRNLADSSRVFDLDDVVVISQPKENFGLRRQALSSSVFTSSEMSALHVRDLRELSSYVPSFVMPNYGARLTSSMYIRGIGSRVNSPAVGICLDGMPLIGKSAFNFHTYQLDRVDVLRGPQGTLYGQNTEGGLVRLYSRNPMTYQGTDIRLGWGSHFYRNAEVAHYAKLSNQIALSVAGFYNGQNGFLHNQCTGERADAVNEAGGKLRLVYQPNDRMTFDFVSDYQYVRQNGFPYGELNLETNTTADPSTDYQSNYRRNMLNTGLNFNYKANGFDFNSNTSYQYLKDYMLMDIDYMPQDYMHMEQRQLQNALTQEFSFKSRNHSPWHWVVGAYGSYQWLRTEAPIYFGDGIMQPIANGIQASMYNSILQGIMAPMLKLGMSESVARAAAEKVISLAGGVSMKARMEVPGLFHTPQFNLAFYHESAVDITDRLTASFGLRYDYDYVKIKYDTQASMAMTADVMGKSATYVLSSMLRSISDDNYNQLLPKFSLSYRLDGEGSNVYATVSKGYRAGGFNIQMFSDILQTELNANGQKAMRGSYDIPHTDADYRNIEKTIAYKPEVSWNYEAGTHLNLFGSRVHFDFSAYYMQVRNQQLSVMAGNYGFGRMMVNAGKSYSCGVEAALRGSAFDNHLAWALNYGLTHAAFKDYTDSVKVNGQYVVCDYKGKRVPFVPMHTFSGSADYTFDIACCALKSIVVGANIAAQGRTYWDEANDYSQDFYAVLGAHADADFGLISLSIWGRNLTNTKYNTFAMNSSATGTMRYFAQKANPFQIGIDVNLHF